MIELIKELLRNHRYKEAISNLSCLRRLLQYQFKTRPSEEDNLSLFNTYYWLAYCHFELAKKILHRQNRRLALAKTYLKKSLDYAYQNHILSNNLQSQYNINSLLGQITYTEATTLNKSQQSHQLLDQAHQYFEDLVSLAEAIKECNSNQHIYTSNNLSTYYWLYQTFLAKARSSTNNEEQTFFFEKAREQLNKKLSFSNNISNLIDMIHEQIKVHHLYAHSFFLQADTYEDDNKIIYLQKARSSFLTFLSLAETLEQPGDNVSQANSWIGRCFLEEALYLQNSNTLNIIHHAIHHFKSQLHSAKNEGLTIEIARANFWLGCAYFAKMQFHHIPEKQLIYCQQAREFFKNSVYHLAEDSIKHPEEEVLASLNMLSIVSFMQARTLSNKQIAKSILEDTIAFLTQHNLENSNQTQNDSQATFLYHLAVCQKDLSQYVSDKEVKHNLLCDALENCKKGISLLSEFNLTDDELLHIEEVFTLKHQEILFCLERFDEYFESKKQTIHNKLFNNQSEKIKFTDVLSSILAVLHILPAELDNTPIAHYTSPAVTEILLGIQQSRQDLRMNSATYMNDPQEGKSLLSLLNQTSSSINQYTFSHRRLAFFTCFSTRVNDLNQFRLYGKENGVEASGCCLIFNKHGNWLRHPNIQDSYFQEAPSYRKLATLVSTDNILNKISAVRTPPIAPSLYQVVYVTMIDEYTDTKKINFELNTHNQKLFGITLRQVHSSNAWQSLRLNQLKIALMQLEKYFHQQPLSSDDYQALEYIRYLFKDFAFIDEEEFRSIKLSNISSKDIQYCSVTNSTFLTFGDATKMVNEVILGTNFEKTLSHRKVEVFHHLMSKTNPHINVKQSFLPINANKPLC